MDNKCLSIVGVEGHGFGTSPEGRTIDRASYISIDGTQEQIHPCTYSVKVQTHSKDTPTYKDVIQSTNEERALWDAAMTKELTSLRDLGSSKIVARPRGANILQSI